ncbi:hypothetical protein CRG98_001021 [Punica granatum]|uniref:Uncharacterized protein n=1 Tax=Punica granatum TaxID=22663 RepID=A0A2I0LDA0_PUNGR|nr:hypothetical protein CRG98_001021 [Punica granatum]
MEMMVPKVRDWDEEDDDMEFEQSTQPGLEDMQCANATVEASQVRARKKSVTVKKRKQKEKGKEKVQEVSKHKRPSYKSKDKFKMTIQTDVAADHDNTIPTSPASPASPPANVGDDVEETPVMDDRLSDGYKSEELESLAGDSYEEKDKFPMYNAKDNRTEEITIGMEFENLDVFKMVVKNTNIVVGKKVNFMKNDKARVRAYCVEKGGHHGCQWKTYCVLNKKTNTYQVMTYDPEHTFGRRIENKLATKEWVAEKLIPKATKLAKQKCEGEENEQYAMLRDYAHEILRSNPSSTVLLQVQPETHEFERWSRSGFDTICKNDALTSNMCEQFNKELLKVRDYWERTPDDHVLHPKMKRQPGRPKKRRKKVSKDKANLHKFKRQLNDPKNGRNYIDVTNRREFS